jgi:hypothetical protein
VPKPATPPAAKDDTAPAAGAATAPAAKPGKPAAAKADTTPAAKPATPPAAKAGTAPAGKPGTPSAAKAGTSPAAEAGTAPAGRDASAPPIPGYDGLTLASLRARMRSLDTAGMNELLAYERAHAGREPVIAMYERRLEKLRASSG